MQKPAINIPPLTDTGVHWVAPRLVCEIKYNELTQENILRQPSFIRLRDDKQPKEVIL